MLGLLTSRAGRYMLAALAGMAVLAGVYLAGAQHGRQAAESEALRARQETRDQVRGIEDETRKASDGDLVDWLTRP